MHGFMAIAWFVALAGGVALADEPPESQPAGVLSNVSKGYDGGFVFGDEDFSLKINGQVQFRWIGNDDGTEDVRGFTRRRTKLKASGQIGDVQYKIAPTWAAGSGTGDLEDSWIGMDLGGNWSLRAGGMKGPFLREEAVSSSKQIAVERSIANEIATTDWQEGVLLAHGDDHWRTSFFYGNGFNQDNRNFDFDAPGTHDCWQVRTEYLAGEGWKPFSSLRSSRGDEAGWLLGAAWAGERNSDGTGTDATDDRWTVDWSYRSEGWNVLAWMARTAFDDDAVGAAPAAQEVDVLVVQASLVLSDRTELFARYEDVVVDADGVEDGFDIMTIGLNHALGDHLLFTADVGFADEQLLAPANATGSFGSGNGWVAGSDGNDQAVIRAQLQLVF